MFLKFLGSMRFFSINSSPDSNKKIAFEKELLSVVVFVNCKVDDIDSKLVDLLLAFIW